MNIAIIPARGGSVRIPRKNIKKFSGKPMIAYAIENAIKSNIFHKVIVSSEDKEILTISKEYGAEIPFERKSSLADGNTNTIPVIENAIQECENLGMTIENVCCIYPCSPFITPEDLINSFKLLNTSEKDYVIPVTEFGFPIQRAVKLNTENELNMFQPEYELSRSQDLEPAYHDTGTFYWGKRDSWFKNNRFYSSATGYIIPKFRVVDIDTHEDWVNAELKFQALQKY